MKLSEYLLDRIFSLICMLVAALVLLALLWLIETPAVFILFAEVILLAAYSTALLYDFFRKQSFYNLLQKMTEQMDIKTLLGELMVPPHFLEGQILVDVLRCCNKYQNDRLSYAEQENREYREYNGTYRYVAAALQSHPEITVGGATLQRAEDNVLQETYVMTSVGNNDRGTLIVPDSVTASLEKDVNVLLVQYKPDADSNEVLQKMIPIGLDSTHGYRYAEKNMMYETFYGLDALVSFLCCYIGLVFLLICAALLALKQLTETTDNVYR